MVRSNVSIGRPRLAPAELRILDAARPEDRDAWIDLWRRWPARDVMAHPEYVSLFARPCDRAVAAVSEDAGGTVLLPLLLRPLSAERWAPGEEAWDATSPYGYGGPFAWSEGALDDAPFWSAYEEWCREARVVCTFLRLSLFREQLGSIPGRVEVRGPNVVVSLAQGPDAAFKAYDRDVRRNLRVAGRQGVTVEVDLDGTRLAEFHEVYEHTMARRGAEQQYRFPRAFFERIRDRLGGHFAFVHALAAGRVLSSELVLVSERHVVAFLGGTRSEAFVRFPNEAVKHGTVEWACARGKHAYVLGGGYAPNDGLLRHKRAFAPDGIVEFRTASLVHDEAAYHALVRRREAAAHSGGPAWVPRAGFFPAYRA